MVNNNVKVQVGGSLFRVGTSRVVEGSTVEFVDNATPAHIRFQKYTRDFTHLNSRPYVVLQTKRGYKSLDDAVRALFKDGFQPL